MTDLKVCDECGNAMASVNGEYFCLAPHAVGLGGGLPDIAETLKYLGLCDLPPELADAELDKLLTVEDFRRVTEGYLNSHICMQLFAKLTLYRASGENPKVKVARRGQRLRVSLVRSNGEVEHFNRDGGS